MNTVRFILICAAVLLGLYLVFVLGPAIGSFFTVFGRRKVTPLYQLDMTHGYLTPYREELLTAADRLEAVPHTEVRMTAADGAVLAADWYDRGSSVTVIMVHGFSADKLTNFAVQADLLVRDGYNVLLPENRAHARSGGKRSTMGICEQYDVLAWTEYASGTLGSRQIVLYGMSMGCTAVSYASDKLDPDKVRALVLDCGYTSPWEQMRDDMRKWHVPNLLLMPHIRLLGRLVLKADIRTPVTDSLNKCRIPALFIHGTDDHSVLFERGQTNYRSCASEKQALFVEGADHTVSCLRGGDTALCTLMTFIDRNTERGTDHNASNASNEKL